MAIQIGAKPDSGFDDPIGMLTDCHRRIEQFLKMLATVVERAAGRGLTGEETAAVTAALQYFRTGGVRHTADEEESLFPRLRATGRRTASRSSTISRAIIMTQPSCMTGVETIYREWITGGSLSADREQELHSAMERLTALYGAHIEVEESIVFPQAAQVLDRAVIASIGQEFRARRV